MEINQLRHFLKIAELGRFTAAARECHLSQPALSQQIARLEAELGCPVFERKGRRVELTEAGVLLRKRAAQIVTLADDTARQIRDDGVTGRVVLAAIPTIAPYLLPDLLRTFRERIPGAQVEVNEDVTESLLKRCQLGEVDLGILALPVSVPYLEVEPLFEDELFLVLPAGHALAGKKSVGMEDLKAEPFVLLSEAHCLSDSVQAVCHQSDFQPVATGRLNQLATVQELVALGHGVSLVPEMARRVDASPLRVYRRLAPPRPVRKIAVCWNPYRYQTKLVRLFLETIRGYGARTGGQERSF